MLSNDSTLSWLDRSANAEADRLAKLAAEATRVPKEICQEIKACDRAYRLGKWIGQATVAAAKCQQHDGRCIRDSQPGPRQKRVPRIQCSRNDSDLPLAHHVPRSCGRSNLDLDMGPLVQSACRQLRRRRGVRRPIDDTQAISTPAVASEAQRGSCSERRMSLGCSSVSDSVKRGLWGVICFVWNRSAESRLFLQLFFLFLLCMWGECVLSRDRRRVAQRAFRMWLHQKKSNEESTSGLTLAHYTRVLADRCGVSRNIPRVVAAVLAAWAITCCHGWSCCALPRPTGYDCHSKWRDVRVIHEILPYQVPPQQRDRRSHHHHHVSHVDIKKQPRHTQTLTDVANALRMAVHNVSQGQVDAIDIEY